MENTTTAQLEEHLNDMVFDIYDPKSDSVTRKSLGEFEKNDWFCFSILQTLPLSVQQNSKI